MNNKFWLSKNAPVYLSIKYVRDSISTMDEASNLSRSLMKNGTL